MHPDSLIDVDYQAHILNLPVELHYYILSFLEIRGLLALRQTCKHFLVRTQEPGFWTLMFNQMQEAHPLPCSRSDFATMQPAKRERILMAADEIKKSLLVHRERVINTIVPAQQPECSLTELSFVSNRFLLSADITTLINVWDLSRLPSSSFSPLFPSARLRLLQCRYLTYTVSLSDEGPDTLYVAAERDHPTNRIIFLYSLSLEPNAGGLMSFNIIADIHLTQAEHFAYMDPPSCRALIYHSGNAVDIYNWKTKTRITVPMQPLHVNDLNGFSKLRFVGPYILCIRNRTIEAHPIADEFEGDTPLPALHYESLAVFFRSGTLSPAHRSCSESGEVYTLFMLVNDVFRGTMHYRIELRITPVPSLSLKLFGRGGLELTDPRPPPNPNADSDDDDDFPSPPFISTTALDPTGLHGLYVARQRGNLDRKVVAFSTDPARLRSKDSDTLDDILNHPRLNHLLPGLDGKVIYGISSYDLRDDVTACAVSGNGRVALGSRIGHMILI